MLTPLVLRKYSCAALHGKKEGNALFNNILNTFYYDKGQFKYKKERKFAVTLMAFGAKEKSVFLDITLVFCGLKRVCTHTQNTHTHKHTLYQ